MHKKTLLDTTKAVFNLLIVIIALFLGSFLSLRISAQEFNPNEVLRTKDFYFLPSRFDSAEKIQAFLESQGSILANYSVYISFEPDDSIISPSWTPSQPPRLVPYYATQPYYGSNMRVSDFIWELSRGSLNNGCNSGGLCADNTINPINPAFVLAIIQKESGLVMGACARADADTNPACPYSSPSSVKKLQHRLERATGYTCYETTDPTKQCRDENPNWRFFKGFFRQVYYSMRWYRITVQRCDAGLPPPGLPHFYTGNTVMIGGQNVTLNNGITCAMYVYTPHISNLTASVLRNMQGDVNFVEETGRPSAPIAPVRLF